MTFILIHMKSRTLSLSIAGSNWASYNTLLTFSDEYSFLQNRRDRENITGKVCEVSFASVILYLQHNIVIGCIL